VAQLSSVSCSAPGTCSAVGLTSPTPSEFEPIVASETDYQWTSLDLVSWGSGSSFVPHSSTTNFLQAISCASAGNCTAVGSYHDANGYAEAMSVTQSGGTWGAVTPATYPTDSSGNSIEAAQPGASFTSVSCVGPGDCTAAGQFKDAQGNTEAMVQPQSNGSWAPVVPATFSGARSATPSDYFQAISCTGPGACTAVGQYVIAAGSAAMAATEVGGHWSDVVPTQYGTVNGRPVHNAASYSDLLYDVSCASPGNCAGAGWFEDAQGNTEAMTVDEVDGAWMLAVPAPFGPGQQAAQPNASYYLAVSCAAPQECTAAGYFADPSGGYQAATSTEWGGVWQPPVAVTFPSSTPSTNNDVVDAVSCALPGNCEAVGRFSPVSGGMAAMAQGLSTPLPPGAPTNVVVRLADGSPTVSWTAPASSGTSPILRHTATAAPGGQTCTFAPPATSCTLVGLVPGTYRVSVTATSSEGTSPSSAPSPAFSVPAPTTSTSAVVPTSSATTQPPTTTTRAQLAATGSDLDGLVRVSSVALAAGIVALGPARRRSRIS
jgi:Fibronectin type III domain